MEDLDIDKETLDKFVRDMFNHDKKFINYLMGEVMKADPKLDPKRTRELLTEKIKGL